MTKDMDMRAVILAGGKGTRLAPYTTVFPKPLMPIDDMPILEVVVRQLRHHGIRRLTFAVEHLAELLMAYFGDGSKYGVEIEYSREEQPLGTAGPLKLIPALTGTFLLMNGDVLTDLPYAALVDAHKQSDAVATIAMHKREVKVDLGVIQLGDDNRVTGYLEKPSQHYRVSMGVYVFEPKALSFIGEGERLDFPDLILRLIKAGEVVKGYPYDGYWMDIGRHEDYEQAVEDFRRNRERLLPEGPNAKAQRGKGAEGTGQA